MTVLLFLCFNIQILGLAQYLLRLPILTHWLYIKLSYMRVFADTPFYPLAYGNVTWPDKGWLQ